jgi:hypothetical protein
MGVSARRRFATGIGNTVAVEAELAAAKYD